MEKVTIRGVLKCACTGSGKVWAGYVTEGQVVPEGLVETPVEVLDPGNASTDRWVLAHPVAILPLSNEDLSNLSAGEMARAAKAKLSDAELAALGLTRD